MRLGQDKVLLNDILSAIEWIEKHTEDISEEEFKKNDVLAYAVIKNIEIMGEASAGRMAGDKRYEEHTRACLF
jgi:uncharacterized protein with HEPN domain